MTSHNPVISHANVRVPVAILAPLIVILSALYPAVWNPSQLVRQVGATVLILSLVWLVLAAAATLDRHVSKVVDRHKQSIREDAIAELDTIADVEWDALVRQIYNDPSDWPDDFFRLT
ncbi:MAG TPA: hypothetical protein VGX25_06870 [Actinophytocola sp.]|uniref:hypothetical protein n=1 Tax=Actinophytocola sp. TaxID=1872138 RepID=UPI002DDD6A70|nr:hypothetical protein [Actinophytocola sp.]HEV2779111.1 hypothetical protein [Actinophytocola sp.]